jgi:DNA repair exonuclease SbcCD ATPase subunit
MEAHGRLARAERDWAEAVEALRNSGDDLPLRDAAAAVIEARANLNEQRDAALKPLRRDQDYQEQSRELALAEIRLEELKAVRLSAELELKTLDPAVPREITRLSVRVLELRRIVTDAEAQALENHRGYAEAEEQLTQSFAAAESAARALRELRRDNPRLQAAVASLKAAGADIARLSTELAAANQRYGRAAASVAAAQIEVARAGRKR